MISVFVAVLAGACLFVLFGLSTGHLRGGCGGCGCASGACEWKAAAGRESGDGKEQ